MRSLSWILLSIGSFRCCFIAGETVGISFQLSYVQDFRAWPLLCNLCTPDQYITVMSLNDAVISKLQ